MVIIKALTIENMHDVTIESLKKVRKKVNHKMKKRIEIIILLLENKNIKQISDYQKISDQSIRTYIKAFNKGGINELLHTSPKTGRNSKLTKEQVEKVLETVKQSPSDVGFSINTTWHCNTLAEYIFQEFKVKLTSEGVRYMLKKNNFSFTRPSYVLAKANKEKQENFKKLTSRIKKK